MPATRAPSSAQHLRADVVELPLLYPVTTELPACSDGLPRRAFAISTIDAAAQIAAHLEAGRTVAVISEGDPLFYGSYMHLHTRLAPRFATEIVAGVTGMSGCWSAAGMPIAQGDDVFTVLPATLPEAELARRLADADAAVVMKVGRHLPKLRRALQDQRPACRAPSMSSAAPWRRENRFRSPPRPTMTRPISPWCWCRAGRNGHERTVSPSSARARATPRYLTPRSRRSARRPQSALRLRALSRSRAGARGPEPPSRPTIARKARAPQPRCATPRRARASPSSPAAIPASSPWRRRSARRSKPGRTAGARSTSQFVPGITAMLAVAARIGAPLGHDFCAMSLSDNLKPWDADRTPARRGGGRGLRHRALQSGVAGAAVAARQGASSGCAGICRQRRRWCSAAPSAGRRTDERRDARRSRRGARRHGDTGHRRLARDARDRAAGTIRRWSTRRAPRPR